MIRPPFAWLGLVLVATAVIAAPALLGTRNGLSAATNLLQPKLASLQLAAPVPVQAPPSSHSETGREGAALSVSAEENGYVAPGHVAPAGTTLVAHASARQLSVRIAEGQLSNPQTWTFDPPTLTVRVGDTVTWTNDGTLPHTIKAEDGAFDSDIIARGKQWSLTPSTARTFHYLCALHPGMKGTLIVEGTSQALVEAASGEVAQEVPGAPTSDTVSSPVLKPASQPAEAAPVPGTQTSPADVPQTGRPISAQIVASGFSPPTITARVGDTITWTNTDGRKHTVTAADGSFDSGILATGAQWSWTAERVGTFSYLCELHPDMRGTVVVTDGIGAPAPQPAAAAPATGVPAAPTPQPTLQPTATLEPQPSATSAPASPPAGGRQVSAQIVATGFNPSTINVAVGDTIIWTNTDGRKHTVTANDGSFNSGTVNPGAQWGWTATKAGTFAYVCEFHSDMRATLVVAASVPSPQPTAVSGASAQSTTVPTQAPQPTAQALIAPTRAEMSLAGSSAYPSASGQARFESNSSSRKLRVELRGAAALKGTTVDVLLGGSKIGSMTIESNGDGRFELDSTSGATAPASVAGQTLEIKTGGGALVVSGRFP